MPLGQHLLTRKTKLSVWAKMTHVQGYLDIRGASFSSPAAGWVPNPTRGAHIGLGELGGYVEAEGEGGGRGRGFRLLGDVCGVCAASFLSQQHGLPEKEPYVDGT